MKSIFVSYRRSDSQSATDHLCERLRDALPRNILFRDVDNIRLGADWKASLQSELADCDVMLVIIGRSWASVRDSSGRRRIDDPSDVVRLEIEAGLKRSSIQVIPVTVEGASLPQATELPDSLHELLERQAAQVRPGSDFDSDTRKLIRSIDRYRIWRRLKIALVSVLAIFFIAVGLGYCLGWIGAKVRLSGNAGVLLYDSHVEVRVPRAASGTLLAEEPYKVSIECGNATSMPLHISKLVTESHNVEAARLFGKQDSLVFTATDHVPRTLASHETTSISVRLNQILPGRLTITVYHNQAADPVRFDVDLNAKALSMSPPRYLSRKQIFQGLDGKQAVDRAWPIAKAWNDDAGLIAAFPGNNETLIDSESRFKYQIVEQWVVTFFSRQKNRSFMMLVTADDAQGREVKNDDGFDIKAVASIPPTIGNQDALDVANRASLLCADWHEGTRLAVVPVNGEPSLAWILSYRSPDGLPIFIHAITGGRLKPAGERQFQIEPLSAAPLRPRVK